MQHKQLIVAGCLAGLAACGGPGSKEDAPDFQPHYANGNFSKAASEADRAIAEEGNVALSDVRAAEAEGLAPNVAVDSEMALLFFNRAMLALAEGNPELALDLMGKSSGVFEACYHSSNAEYFPTATSILLDDSRSAYSGPDYEQVMAPLMMSILDVLTVRRDHLAYTREIGRVQDNILGSDLGDEEYRPRQGYRRVALGKYFEGLIDEEELRDSEAVFAYETAATFLGEETGVIEAALGRTREGVDTLGAGEGSLHVLYLGGRGPHLVQQTFDPDVEIITRLIGVLLVAVTEDLTPLFTAPVPVPVVVVNDPNIPALTVSIDAAGVSASTEVLLDVNLIATEQLETNRDMLIARAIMRRALKSAAITSIEKDITDRENEVRGTNSNEGIRGFADQLFQRAVDPEVLALRASLLLWTGLEEADTRSWTTLPANFQVARLALPQGDHVVALGDGSSANVRIQSGRASFLVVVQPALGQPATVIVDSGSRPLE